MAFLYKNSYLFDTITSMDDEIKQLMESIGRRKDTHPDYMPDKLEQLQALVLASHARMENALETRIYLQIRKKVKPLDQSTWLSVRDAIRPLIEPMSYANKVKIIESYGDKTDNLLGLLWKMNGYRIEFAHPNGMDLRQKYNFADPQGKQYILQLLKCLDEVEREMDNYFIKVDGVPKMREK